MKKLVFALVAGMVMTFTACGNQTKASVETNGTDSVVVDSVVADTLTVDSVAKSTTAKLKT